jgi:hypothetical protein
MKKTILTIFVFFVAILSANETIDYRVGENELFIMPTAYTMPQGRFYFASYELIIINMTFAPTNRSQIGFYSLFPISTEFLQTVTILGKQNWLQTERFSSAFWGSYTPEAKFALIGNVFSFGKKDRGNFHFSFTNAFEFGKSTHHDLIFMAGAKFPFTTVTSFLVEIYNSEALLDEDFNGLLNIGLRFHSNRFAIDVAGIRPLENTGEFLFFPFLKVVIMLD